MREDTYWNIIDITVKNWKLPNQVTMQEWLGKYIIHQQNIMQPLGRFANFLSDNMENVCMYAYVCIYIYIFNI